MTDERVDYRQGAKVGEVVAPEELPAKRVDDEPTRDAARAKGGGAGARNVSGAAPEDAALEKE